VISAQRHLAGVEAASGRTNAAIARGDAAVAVDVVFHHAIA
jgi:hypothetical protein